MTTQGVVHIVDDDEMFRKALAGLVELAGHIVRTYSSAGDFLIAYQPTQSAECLILDMQMPGPSGLELHEALVRQTRYPPVIFLSAFGDVPSTVRAMRNGAVDFLTKPVARAPLLAAIDAAVDLHLRRRIAAARRHELRSRVDSLSPREAAIYELVVAGKRNKEIAAELNIAERTVKTHRAQLMTKMVVASVAELAELAFELHAEQDDAPRSR
jgi:FixJ family two-component response regulator